jgi:hypothetical protein
MALKREEYKGFGLIVLGCQLRERAGDTTLHLNERIESDAAYGIFGT